MLILFLGVLLTALFFLHIKSAADILCRIIGGFSVLLIYNALALHFCVPEVGINLFSAITAGLLGIPGGALLICCAIFL